MNQRRCCKEKQCEPSTDHGPMPYVLNIDLAAKKNKTFRTAIWTGNKLQTTLMCIPCGECIGMESHPHTDQFFYIVEGRAIVKMGENANNICSERAVCEGYSIFVPCGTWHNVINTGNTPLKLYTIYAPPEHPRGTVHNTKADAQAHEH